MQSWLGYNTLRELRISIMSSIKLSVIIGANVEDGQPIDHHGWLAYTSSGLGCAEVVSCLQKCIISFSWVESLLQNRGVISQFGLERMQHVVLVLSFFEIKSEEFQGSSSGSSAVNGMLLFSFVPLSASSGVSSMSLSLGCPRTVVRSELELGGVECSSSAILPVCGNADLAPQVLFQFV